jgi:hypothetical protein
MASAASGGELNSNIGNNNNATNTISTVETTYLLALYCNDSLWDRVAEIAVQSAKANDLEMDVNKQVLLQQKQQAAMNGNHHGSHPSKPQAQKIPEPTKPVFDRPSDAPFGVGLHALTFLLGLALSKPPETTLYDRLCHNGNL